MRISKQVVIMAVLMMASAVAFSHAQEPTRNYSDTRKLLLKMDRTRANGAFTKIVREADIRRTSLLAAVDDDTDKVQVNAQVIIRYMGDPEMLRALDDRIKAHLAKHLRLASPIISPIEADMYLYGSDTDPMKIVKKNASLFHGSQFNSGETHLRLIGYNKRLKVAVIEMIEGQVFTSEWHLSIKLEDGRWRVVADTNVWLS